MAETANPESGTFVTVERRQDDVALVRLDWPKANALSGLRTAKPRW